MRKVNTDKIQNLVNIHETYKQSIFNLEIDLRFWHYFITQWAIPEYQKQFGSKLMNSAAYSTFDSSPITAEGHLRIFPDIHEIHSQDLESHSSSLFNWVMNAALVRAYNALEILMLQAISIVYLHLPEKNPARKAEMNEINSKIKKSLSITDQKNNNHLIQFLKERSPDLASWMQLKIREDISTTWEEFFYLNSILRHSIVHQGMVLNKDLVNDINSRLCKDLFKRHFNLSGIGNNNFELQPVQDLFNNFLALNTEFAVNILKISSGQPNLGFLNLI